MIIDIHVHILQHSYEKDKVEIIKAYELYDI